MFYFDKYLKFVACTCTFHRMALNHCLCCIMIFNFEELQVTMYFTVYQKILKYYAVCKFVVFIVRPSTKGDYHETAVYWWYWQIWELCFLLKVYRKLLAWFYSLMINILHEIFLWKTSMSCLLKWIDFSSFFCMRKFSLIYSAKSWRIASEFST